MTTATVTPIRREFQVHRFDPIRHGVLSRHIALPWEDREAFEEILRGLLVEHQPQGPTAYHLVEDLAGVIWRKRRLLQAEGAAIRQRLHGLGQTQGADRVAAFALAHMGGGMRTTIAEILGGHLPTVEGLARSLAAIDRALEVLDGGGPDAFAQAAERLDEATREMWACEARDLTEAGTVEPTDGQLGDFLRSLRPVLEGFQDDAAKAPLVVEQAHGMAIDIQSLERIAKLEAHLDAKLQRLLTLLQQQSRKAQPVRSRSGEGGRSSLTSAGTEAR